MKHKICLIAVFAALAGSLCLSPALAGTYSGGSGTAEDPYKISTVADWQELIASSADWDKHFILLNDIDFGGAEVTPVGRDVDPGKSGFQGTAFSGVFKGNGHVLHNAVINQPGKDYVGLFGSLQWKDDTPPRIVNLGLENVTVIGRYAVGSLVGGNNGNWGYITSCYTTGSVTGVLSVGGLVGENSRGGIVSSYSMCSVQGSDHVGGLVGTNLATITACYAAGSVTGSGHYIGGIAGFGDCPIEASFWDIETSGQIGSSGGKGLTTIQMKTKPIFQNADWSRYDWILDDGRDYPHLDWQNMPGARIPYSNRVPLTGWGTPAKPYQIWTQADFALLSWHVSVLDHHFMLMTDLDMSGVLLYPFGDLGRFEGTFNGNGHVIRNATIEQPSSDFIGLFGTINDFGQIWNLNIENMTAKGRRFVGGLAGYHRGIITSSSVTGSITGIECVGGLCGSLGDGSIALSRASCSVDGGTNVGGLCGYINYGSIANSHASGTVTGQTQVGGLCGSMTGALMGGMIFNSDATGDVNGDSYVGGLCGRSNGGWIFKSYATGGVIGGQSEVGGLCGENYQGGVVCCYATGSVGGGVYGNVGGLCGSNYYGEIFDSFAAGSVSGPAGIGGLCGSNFFGRINNCYASGSIGGGQYGAGSLCGANLEGTISDCFWDMETSGLAASDGGTGKTTEEMKTLSTFTSAGWDFTDSDGNPAIWWMPENHYPALVLLCYSGGDGSMNNPYRISTVADWWGLIASIVDWDKSFLLTADLDFAGAVITPVGIYGTPFTGVMDGASHTLSNLKIDEPQNGHAGDVGLFGYVNGGQIKNLGLVNANIKSLGTAGGLVGYSSYGTITSCYATGTVKGDICGGGLVGNNFFGSISSCYATNTVTGCSWTGGLVGHNDSGTISSCYATGAVDGDEDAGGLAGGNSSGTIMDCYSTGAVMGAYNIGGLVGSNSGTISSCFSTGTATGYSEDGGGLVGGHFSGTINGCFWDMETSGLTTSEGGTGKTTEEMKSLSTFTNANWDFVRESANGTANTWRMCVEGVDYPRLAWEFSQGGDFDCPNGVAIDDLLYLSARWLATTPEIIGASDANSDGKVDLSDLAILAENWLK